MCVVFFSCLLIVLIDSCIVCIISGNVIIVEVSVVLV